MYFYIQDWSASYTSRPDPLLEARQPFSSLCPRSWQAAVQWHVACVLRSVTMGSYLKKGPVAFDTAQTWAGVTSEPQECIPGDSWAWVELTPDSMLSFVEQLKYVAAMWGVLKTEVKSAIWLWSQETYVIDIFALLHKVNFSVLSFRSVDFAVCLLILGS